MRDLFVPEVGDLIEGWEDLSLAERGERTGFIVGKYGSDFVIPAVSAKAISKGVKGAKELTIIAKNFKKAEQVIVLEALAETGGQSGKFAESVNSLKMTEKFVPHSSDILKNIKNVSSISTKNDIWNIMKPSENLQWIGKRGSSNYIRIFEGTQNEAMQVFKELTKDAKLLSNGSYPGELYALKDGTKIGFRPLSKSGPPTIDLDIPGCNDNIKLKFMEN